MPAVPDVKSVPRWAWIVAIGGGLIVGYFILRRSGGGGGEAAAGAPEGAPMVPPMDNAAAGGGVAGSQIPQTLPGSAGGGTDSLNPLNTFEPAAVGEKATVTTGGATVGNEAFTPPLENAPNAALAIGGAPTPNTAGGNVNYYGGVLAAPDEPATPLIMVTPPPAPVPQYVKPALDRYGGVRMPEPV